MIGLDDGSSLRQPEFVSMTGRLSSQRRPYYIVSPRFDSKSAGIKTLYLLCHILNMMGEEAYILLETPGMPAGAPGDMFCPNLTRAISDGHFAVRRVPIQVLPETSTLHSDIGIVVRYVLNYLGVVGGPREIPTRTDLVVAYSQRIANSLTQSDMVLFLPISDIGFWRPRPELGPREGVCAYLGKRRDVDGLGLPSGLQVNSILTRDSSREDIRLEFWRREAVYVFENTAIIGEALLCGCPVICGFNEQFPNLLADVELGSDGVVSWPCTSDQLAKARQTASLYSDRYLSRMELVEKDIRHFIKLTQEAPLSRPSDGPVVVPRLQLVEIIGNISKKLISLATGLHELGFIEVLRRVIHAKMRVQ